MYTSMHVCVHALPLPALVVRYILPEGDGNLDKGMKLEWATEKDGSLVVGSFGKEYTDNDGRIVNTNNNWIITIDPHGVISRQDWTQQYKSVQTAGVALVLLGVCLLCFCICSVTCVSGRSCVGWFSLLVFRRKKTKEVRRGAFYPFTHLLEART